MGWLRLRPTGYEELDMVDSRGRWIGEERSSDEEDKEPPGPERRGKFDEVSSSILSAHNCLTSLDRTMTETKT